MLGYLPYLLRGQFDLEPKSSALARFKQQVDTSKIPLIAAATQRAGVWNCPTLAIIDWFEAQVADQWGGDGLMISAGDAYDVPGPGGTQSVRRQIVKALQDAGAGLLSGTDAAPPDGKPPVKIHQELEALVRAGLTRLPSARDEYAEPSRLFRHVE